MRERISSSSPLKEREREGAPESQGLERGRGRQAGGGSSPSFRYQLVNSSITLAIIIVSSPHRCPFLSLRCFSSNSSRKKEKKRFLVYRFLVAAVAGWFLIQAETDLLPVRVSLNPPGAP